MTDHAKLETAAKMLSVLWSEPHPIDGWWIAGMEGAQVDLLAALEAEPAQDSAPGSACEVANHFNVEAAASGECEWCADIAKAHAAGCAEEQALFRSWLIAHEGYVVKLPEADHAKPSDQ